MSSPYQSPASGSFKSLKNTGLLSERANGSRLCGALLIGFVANGLVVFACTRLAQHPAGSFIRRPLFDDAIALGAAILIALMAGVPLCIRVAVKSSGRVRAVAVLGVLVNLAPYPFLYLLFHVVSALKGFEYGN